MSPGWRNPLRSVDPGARFAAGARQDAFTTGGAHTGGMRTETRTGPTRPAARDTTSHLPALLDVEGVAEVLGVSVRYVRRLVAERRIPYIKWGRYLRFDPKELA